MLFLGKTKMATNNVVCAAEQRFVVEFLMKKNIKLTGDCPHDLDDQNVTSHQTAWNWQEHNFTPDQFR